MGPLTLELFLSNGAFCAATLRRFDRYGEGQRERSFQPALAAMLLEAWLEPLSDKW